MLENILFVRKRRQQSIKQAANVVKSVARSPNQLMRKPDKILPKIAPMPRIIISKPATDSAFSALPTKSVAQVEIAASKQTPQYFIENLLKINVL